MRADFAVVAIVAAFLLGACAKTPPTDKEMSEAFFSNRAAFETLRTDLCRLKYDQTVMRDPSWAQPQMRPADEKRIRDELAALGAIGVRYMRGCQLWIEMWSSGPGREPAFKKFRYGPPMYRIIELKEPDAKDLNVYMRKRVRNASYEKKLDGDWWIEVDHWR
ncbi:MAG: hypothetical protein JSR60_00185 [Proteobacteria bacterium]|nr:hypothetical protein [Pseudomonadota bacterium]